jgi:hypothetical protein
VHHLQTAYGIVNGLQVEMEEIRMLSKSLVKSEARLFYA